MSAPYRVTFGGGGTDLPGYAGRFGGVAVTATLARYVWVWAATAPPLRDPSDGTDPLTTTALIALGRPETSVRSRGDLPAGTGLGSSGAYLVALTMAVRALEHVPTDPRGLAATAYEIEAKHAGLPVGTQDAYAASYGGFLEHRIGTDGAVEAVPIDVTAATIAELEARCLLVYTGLRRSSAPLLYDQQRRTGADDAITLDALHRAKELAVDAQRALVDGCVDDVGAILHEQWETKVRRDARTTNPTIDSCYARARAMGAIGGKLVGAGGGGFLLLVASDGRTDEVRDAVTTAGFVTLDVRFEREGAAVRWRGGPTP